MKKLAVLLCTALLAGTILVGCGDTSGTGNDKNSEQTPNNDKDNNKADGFVFKYKDVEITPHAKMEPIHSALGKEDNYFESDSCAFQGKDKVYTYGSVVIATYPDGDADYVYTIELKDDTVTTAKGIAIGSTKDDVIAKYGEAQEDTGVALLYEKGSSTLSFSYDADGNVTGIVYAAVVE